MTRTRLIKGVALVAVAVAIGVATLTWPRAEAVLPGWCYNRCGSSSSCSLLCTNPNSGEVITCEQWGTCSGSAPPSCSTYPCPAGCAPKPSWSYSPSEPEKGSPVLFTPVTSNINPSTCNWDFGDGQHQLGCEVQHTYSNSGVYKVCFSANETTCGTVQFRCKSDVVVYEPGGGHVICDPICHQYQPGQ